MCSLDMIVDPFLSHPPSPPCTVHSEYCGYIGHGVILTGTVDYTLKAMFVFQKVRKMHKKAFGARRKSPHKEIDPKRFET